MANSWAILAGLAAACLPVLIHWLTRPKPVRVSVSTLRFIQGAVAERRSRYRLRDLLVLIFRTLAVLLFAAAIARPLMNKQQVQSETDNADVTRVVLLDCSQSMAARDRGVIRFERARPLAASLLRYQPDMQANLLLAAASPAPVFDSVTTNLWALRDALTDSSVKSQRLRVQTALNAAAEVFESASPDSTLELHIISDFQRSNWAAADFSVLPKNCATTLQTVCGETAAPNLALSEVLVKGRVEQGRDAELAVRVSNLSDTPRMAQVEVKMGATVVPVQGLCNARSEVELNVRLPSATAGWQTGEARLVSADDALSADDTMAVAYRVWPAAKVALLTRDTKRRGTTPAWFLEQALRAGGASEADLVLADAADPDLEALQTTDIVIVARPGRLSAETVGVLKALLQRGRGVCYVAGDTLDAANLADLVKALGSSVRMPVEYLPLTDDRSGTSRFLSEVDRRLSPFAVFGDELTTAVNSLTFRGGLLTRPNPDGLADDVRASLNDQSAFLTVTSAGQGRLVILNVDLQRSSLARTPVLVPLLSELMANDLGAAGGAGKDFLSGEPLTLQLSVGEEAVPDLSVHSDTRELTELSRGRFRSSPSGVFWNAAEAAAPGVYEIRRADTVVDVVTTRMAEEESDLRSLSEDVFLNRLAGDRTLSYAAGGIAELDTQDVVWVWLGVGCVVCLLLELLTLKLFRI